MINTKRNKIVTAGDGIEVFLAKWTQNEWTMSARCCYGLAKL